MATMNILREWWVRFTPQWMHPRTRYVRHPLRIYWDGYDLTNEIAELSGFTEPLTSAAWIAFYDSPDVREMLRQGHAGSLTFDDDGTLTVHAVTVRSADETESGQWVVRLSASDSV